MRLTRRLVLGAASAALVPARALAADDADAALRRALDSLPREGAPGDKLHALAGFRVDRLSPSSAIDLETVRAGLGIDARLATAAPDDDAHFALLLERRLGEAIAPAAAHAMLLAKARQLHSRADTLLRHFGLTRGTVGDRIVAFYRDPRWLYPDSSAGRDAAVADMNRWLDASRARISREFGPVPPQCLDVSVRRMSPADEAARKGGYRTVPNARASGAYFVDLSDIARRPSWSLASVVQHETLPGHLLQLPIESLANPHPLRLEYLPAFAEGWAIYAEQLGEEGGAFAGDPAMQLGHTHWLLFRIARGVIDTGIHHGRWTSQEAQRTLRELQGEPAYFATFASELDRVIREPAMRAAEALVWLRLVSLRDRYRAKGFKVNFHQLVLRHGRQRMDRIAKLVQA